MAHTEDNEAVFVFDKSALLAYLKGDEEGTVVQRVLRQCQDCGQSALISAEDMLSVYAEVAGSSISLLEDVASLLDQLPLSVEPLAQEHLIPITHILIRHPGLTPAQASSLLLARTRKATLVTADPILQPLTQTLYVGRRDEAVLSPDKQEITVQG